MAFIKRDIKDRVVQYPHRYQLVEVSSGIYDLVSVPGTIIEPGTAINKAYLQPIEDGLEDAINSRVVSSTGSISISIDGNTSGDIVLPLGKIPYDNLKCSIGGNTTGGQVAYFNLIIDIDVKNSKFLVTVVSKTGSVFSNLSSDYRMLNEPFVLTLFTGSLSVKVTKIQISGSDLIITYTVSGTSSFVVNSRYYLEVN